MKVKRSDTGKSWRSWIALVGVVGLLLTACGPAGSESTTTAGPGTTTGAPSTTEAPTGTTAAPVAGDPIPMRFGAILPQTGSLSAIVGALEEPLRMAQEEINAISPDLVTVDFTDDGTNADVATANIDQYLTGDHHAVLGPAASGVANAIWDKVNTAGMVMCSGTSTGAVFSAETYNPNHVRTAPSDLIQAPLLADVITGDGVSNIAVIWRADEYGVGFGESLAATLTGAGATVPLAEGYLFEGVTSFSDVAQSVVDSGAEALAMITFGEGAQLLLDLESAGFEGQIYVADGFVDTVTAENVGGRAEVLEGIRGTYPAVAPTTGEATFGDRFTAFAPEGTPTVFSAHMYDCLVTLLLAAQIAQSSDPTVYVDEIVGVTRDGEKCSLVAECLELAWAGTDIDYDGASGVLDFSPNGEPGVGIYNVFNFDATGVSVNEEGVELTGELP